MKRSSSLPADAPRHASTAAPALSACGFVTSYDLPPHTLNVALVRDPFDRFLSAHTDHGSLSDTCPDRYCSVNPDRLLLQVPSTPPRALALIPAVAPTTEPTHVVTLLSLHPRPRNVFYHPARGLAFYHSMSDAPAASLLSRRARVWAASRTRSTSSRLSHSSTS